MTRMDDDRLRQFIERQESRAKRSEVAYEQAQAMDYYLRRPFGNEEEGRSQVISSDVWDVVEGMTPIVLKPFVSSADVVQFNPVGPEDEEMAEQETDYLNYVVTQRNDSFIQFTAWAKAGLLQKNGIVKYWWDKSRKTTVETYEGLSDDVYSEIVNDKAVTVLEHSAQPGVDPSGMPSVVHDVKLRRTETIGQAKYQVVPPEEFLIIGRDPNPQTADFVQHRTRMTLSTLRELGYGVADDIADTQIGDPTSDPQAAARNQNREFEAYNPSDGNGDPSMREVWFRESYCYVDVDGDGIAELRKVCMVGTEVLANEEWDEIPFASWTPYQQLFQFDGRCPADEAIEIQDVKSTLWRQGLDNIYTINNNRVFAGNKVNLDDLLDNQIAGIVRVDSELVGNQVQALPVVPLGAIIQPMIEYTDTVKENRTGWTRYNQGTDADSLNKTATGVRLITQAGNERVALVQRSLAEQGMKPLMLGLHSLCRRHATKAETVRLRGKWVNIDPRKWQMRMDMTVSVGLGTMDKSMELGVQDQIIRMQTGLMPLGVASPVNVYNAAAKFVELTGEKNADKYFTHPDKVEKPDPMQNPEVMMKVKESKQKDRELDQKDYALKQEDYKLKQEDVKFGLNSKEVEARLLMDHTRLVHEINQPQADPALDQQHTQAMDVRKQQMAEQGQAHSQTLAEQQQELAAEQAKAERLSDGQA